MGAPLTTNSPANSLYLDPSFYSIGIFASKLFWSESGQEWDLVVLPAPPPARAFADAAQSPKHDPLPLAAPLASRNAKAETCPPLFCIGKACRLGWQRVSRLPVNAFYGNRSLIAQPLVLNRTLTLTALSTCVSGEGVRTRLALYSNKRRTVQSRQSQQSRELDAPDALLASSDLVASSSERCTCCQELFPQEPWSATRVAFSLVIDSLCCAITGGWRAAS